MSEWLENLAGLIPEEVLEQARDLVAQGEDPGEFLLGRKDVPTGRLLAALSRHYDRPALLLATYQPEPEALESIPEELARRFTILPLFLHKVRIFMATAEPWDLSVEDFIRRKTGLSMESVVALRSDIEKAINRFYLTGAQTARKVRALSKKVADSPRPEPSVPAVTPIEDPDAPSIKLANHILSTGIRLGASDIHLEPFEDRVSLRYRLDGILREHPAPPMELLRAVTSRLKILANLDVSERRLPQDGRITTVVDGRDYDLRISIIPNLFGESIVIRVLASHAEVQDLQALGFAPKMLERYLWLISRPHGVVLVTGPTGSGKTTTLYASLQKLYTPEKKILTLEDPVESRMPGITQFQMNSAIGLTFARTLRSVLRHDPEIVLLGEIRDQETAEIAIRASLTGHLLLSTLHTNDAASAPMRLIDMGVPGYLVMTSLLGVLAQRLLRRLCPRCRIPLQVEPGHLQALGLETLPPEATPYQPVGCAECQNLGYRGRVAVYELLEISPEMRRAPEAELTSEKLLELAGSRDFVSLSQSAVARWLEGLTSFEEVMKITVE
ncbi:MAG: GspE/PulE family protein [Candidatus Xenobium sp.]|jgi:type IV pilus assembly protein PilB|nr:type II/IV secretion system protein [Burkholderiales bacterium]